MAHLHVVGSSRQTQMVLTHFCETHVQAEQDTVMELRGERKQNYLS